MPQTFHIPLMYPDGCQNFPKALEYHFKKYHIHIEKIGCDRETITKAKSFSKSIIKSLNKYFEGRVHAAYLIFGRALRNTVNETKLEFINISAGEVLYRARIEKHEQEKEFDKKDLFHIKFESRTKVQNQRFSISGLPCLYMSESLFACWIEMGRPSIDIFTAASINIEEEIKTFDLCKMYDILMNGKIEDQKKYAHFIHLAIATSFSVLDKVGEFKPEYIIPQFIMQWLLDNNHGISGVKYYCTSQSPDLENKRLFTNYAFPTQKVADVGFCEILNKYFTIKRVMPGRHVQYYNKSANNLASDSKQKSEEIVEISAGLKSSYSSSMFGIFEQLLNNNPKSADGTFTLPSKRRFPLLSRAHCQTKSKLTHVRVTSPPATPTA